MHNIKMFIYLSAILTFFFRYSNLIYSIEKALHANDIFIILKLIIYLTFTPLNGKYKHLGLRFIENPKCIPGPRKNYWSILNATHEFHLPSAISLSRMNVCSWSVSTLTRFAFIDSQSNCNDM
jgi:hypothetical protein